MKRSYKKILVIRFSSLGDILLTTPTLRALKRWNPDAEIHFVVKSEYIDLLKHNPNIDGTIAYDPSTGLAGFLKLIRELKGTYDLLIDLHRSTRSLTMRLLSGARRHLRYPKGVVSRHIMIRTGWKAIAMKDPVPERYLKALEPLGISGDDRGIDYLIPEPVREEVREMLREGVGSLELPGWMSRDPKTEHPIFSHFALAPGARWATKRWLPERFAGVADTLAESHGLVPVFIGHRDEIPVTSTVRRHMVHPALDFTGKLDLLETGALLESSNLLISNDSGLMHMASALGTPIVAVFGPTTRELGFYPYRARYRVVGSSISCRPCHHLGGERCPKGHHRCMTEVDVEDVLEAATNLLEPEVAQTPCSTSRP
jgi:heptosyltransferase-2